MLHCKTASGLKCSGICGTRINGTRSKSVTRTDLVAACIESVHVAVIMQMMSVFMQDHPKYKQAMRARTPEAKLRIILGACQGVTKDEASGAPQPKYR